MEGREGVGDGWIEQSLDGGANAGDLCPSSAATRILALGMGHTWRGLFLLQFQ